MSSVKDKSKKKNNKPADIVPMRIPESSGDLADRAENDIQAELQEQIERARGRYTQQNRNREIK